MEYTHIDQGDMPLTPLPPQEAKIITLPQGMIGFTNLKEFFLSPIKSTSASPLWLLQSMDEPMIQFILCAYHAELFPERATTITQEDLQAICQQTGLHTASFQVFIILSAEHTHSRTRVYGNFRAPLLFDPHQKCAWQVILPNTRYPLRQLLEELSPLSSAPPPTHKECARNF